MVVQDHEVEKLSEHAKICQVWIDPQLMRKKTSDIKE
jgi:hypothetical protein